MASNPSANEETSIKEPRVLVDPYRDWAEGAGSVSITQGGRQLEYEDQDPRIHRKWLEALRQTGVPSEMGEIFDEAAILALPPEALTGVIRQPRSIGPAV